MRLAIAKSNHYCADIYCVDSRSAKKALREESISILAIEFYLVGRETGIELLRWAKNHNVLPNYVVIIERNRDKRSELSHALRRSGYRSTDETTFIRH